MLSTENMIVVYFLAVGEGGLEKMGYFTTRNSFYHSLVERFIKVINPLILKEIFI